jgi:hypothetical protein
LVVAIGDDLHEEERGTQGGDNELGRFDKRGAGEMGKGGEETPPRNVWQELETWTPGFAPWQKLSLGYAIRHGVLTQARIDEVYSVFLHDTGLGADPGIAIPDAITGRPPSGALAPTVGRMV